MTGLLLADTEAVPAAAPAAADAAAPSPLASIWLLVFFFSLCSNHQRKSGDISTFSK